MQFSTLAATFALAAGANAAVIQRDGARLAQFRVFNVEGCDEFNQGFYTVDESDVDVCKSFSAIEDPGVGSVNLEQLNNSDCSRMCYLTPPLLPSCPLVSDR